MEQEWIFWLIVLAVAGGLLYLIERCLQLIGLIVNLIGTFSDYISTIFCGHPEQQAVIREEEHRKEMRCGVCDALLAVFSQDGTSVVDPMSELPEKRDPSM